MTAIAAQLPVAAQLPAVARTPPVVGRVPLIGALLSVLRDAPGAFLDAIRRHPGEIVNLMLGPAAVPLITQPEHIQEVMIDRADEFTKGGMWNAIKPLLGDGVVTSDGAAWKSQRRMLNPLFTPKFVASLGDGMVHAMTAQIELIAERAASGPLEMGAEMTQLTQRVLLETLFGTSLDPEEVARLGRSINVAMEAMNYQIFLYTLPSWIPRPYGGAFKRAIAEVDAALERMLAHRRANPTSTPDVLNRLLQARDEDGEGLSPKQIRDQLITLYVAGLDTTAVTLTWLFHILDRHPEVDRRLRAEVAEVCGGRPPTVADLDRLDYTRRCIQEAMRLYPPAWILPRYSPVDTTVGGYHIPAGTTMMLSPYLTHRSPAVWDNPDAFDPDRFLPEAVARRPKLSWIPFGAGGRMCVGMHFAMVEVQLATVLLVQRFRPTGDPDRVVVPAAASTLKPKGGLTMTFAQVAG